MHTNLLPCRRTQPAWVYSDLPASSSSFNRHTLDGVSKCRTSCSDAKGFCTYQKKQLYEVVKRALWHKVNICRVACTNILKKARLIALLLAPPPSSHNAYRTVSGQSLCFTIISSRCCNTTGY